jgi:two-component system, OmpR family, sensor histidine kinase QseC
MLEALNGLLQRIAGLMESERQFTADAAHELRTPIAAIRAQAQAALGEGDTARRRRALEATIEGCDRAARLVEQLLTLSRLEAGSAQPLVRLDLGPLVRSVVADAAPQAIERQKVIEFDAAEPCPLLGDATLLSVLARNLVDNAILYSPRQGTIKVAVSRTADAIRLKVEDSGPGMATQDIERLGQRFFRVLASGESGSGLGWSIVKRIAAMHGAAVQVGRSHGLGGLSVEIVFCS